MTDVDRKAARRVFDMLGVPHSGELKTPADVTLLRASIQDLALKASVDIDTLANALESVGPGDATGALWEAQRQLYEAHLQLQAHLKSKT